MSCTTVCPKQITRYLADERNVCVGALINAMQVKAGQLESCVTSAGETSIYTIPSVLYMEQSVDDARPLIEKAQNPGERTD